MGYSTEYDAVILKSEDRGRTWGKADQGIPAGFRTAVWAIAIDPRDPNTLFANLRYSGRFGWPYGYIYRGGRAGTWEELSLGDSASGEGVCSANGMAYDPNLRRLYVGCDAYYYNNGDLLLRHSDNAYTQDSGQVAWEQSMSFGRLGGGMAFGMVRPLAVDAREPKTVYVAVSAYGGTAPTEQQIVVSHDDGSTWEALALQGLPGR